MLNFTLSVSVILLLKKSFDYKPGYLKAIDIKQC